MMRSHDDRTLVVLMDGIPLGEVYEDRSRGVRLRYDPAYSSTPGAVPLSLSMPLSARRHNTSVLSPWMDNLLPDRPEVLTRWRREFRVPNQSAFALLRHVGEDVAGAAQFVRSDRVDEASVPGPVEPMTDADVAERLRRLRQDPAAWEPTTGTGQFSLAGSQSKFALHFDGTTWGLPTGRTPTTHIIKPAISGMLDQDLNEHLSLRAARTVGLTVPESGVVTFDGERAFVVRRYDRVRTVEGWERVHQEDMCQALGVSPRMKYEQNGGPSAPDIATLIRENVPSAHAEADVRRFADAIIYNWIIVGTDAHAKNYSMLLARSGQARFAPLYDLNSYLPYQAAQAKPTLSMKVGTSKRRPDLIGVQDWQAFARHIGVPEQHIFTRIKEMSTQLPDAFSTAADHADVTELASDLPGRLTDAVAAKAERCAKIIAPQSKTSIAGGRGRVKRGVPNGGQFTGRQHPESDVHL